MNDPEDFREPLTPIQPFNMMHGSERQVTGDNSNSSLSNLFQTDKPLQEIKNGMIFSDEVTHIIGIVNLLVLATGLSLFGVLTNVLNIMVFKMQGLQETVDINLFAIAVSDMCACLTVIWSAILHNPLLVKSTPHVVSYEIDFLTGGLIHQVAMNATAWLTAAVTFERCLCIVMPLKVKVIVTKARTKFLAASIFFLAMAWKAPIYYTSRLNWKYDPGNNKTVFGLVFIEEREVIDSVTLFVGEFLSAVMSFAIVILSSLVLAVKLGQKRKWRQSVMKDEKATSIKGKRVVKMVAIVAAIYISCYMPTIFIAIMMVIEPEYRTSGKYSNSFIVSLNIANVFESLNASLNFFVYYRMSSKFRLKFREIFCHMKGEK